MTRTLTGTAGSSHTLALRDDGTVVAWGDTQSPANSLQFKARPGSESLEVALGGQVLALFTLSSTADYTLFGADVSSFASQPDELRFTAARNVLGPNDWTLDSIVFSGDSVPEPSVPALFALAVLLMCRRMLCKGD